MTTAVGGAGGGLPPCPGCKGPMERTERGAWCPRCRVGYGAGGGGVARGQAGGGGGGASGIPMSTYAISGGQGGGGAGGGGQRVGSGSYEHIAKVIEHIALKATALDTRLGRTARWAATLAARIVYLKRCARWLLAEAQAEHKAELDELLAITNSLRAEKGLGPLIRVGMVVDGVYTKQWGSLSYGNGESRLVAYPDGMWRHPGAPPQPAQDNSATCPPPGTTPGDTTGEDDPACPN